MGRPSSSRRLVAVLAPWRETAGRLARLVHAPTEHRYSSGEALAGGGRVWLAWEPSRDPDTLLSELQLMELLDLLARVDRDGFEEMVELVCGEREGPQLLYHTTRSDDDEIAHFRFGYHVTVTYREMLSSAGMQRLLTGYGDVEHSQLFLGVKRALLQAWKDRHGKEFDRLKDPVPILLDCAHVPLGCDTLWLFRLVQVVCLQDLILADAVKQRESELEMGLRAFTFVDTEPVFRVQFVRIDLNSELESPRQALTSLTRIVQFGVEISYLRMRSIYLNQVEPETVTQCLHELFAPSQNAALRRSIPSSTPVRGVRHLVLDFFVEYYVFCRLCSVIMHSQTLKELTLIEDPRIQDEIESDANGFFVEMRMQRLGVALFSSDSTHTIETFQFPSDAFFATQFSTLTRASYSTLDLIISNPILDSFASVSRCAKVWLRRPRSGTIGTSSETPYVQFAEGLENIRVLSRESEATAEWVILLLPGWGEAWIDAKDVRSVESDARSLFSRGICSVIAEGVSSTSIDGVVELIEHLRFPIQKLSLVGNGTQLSAADLTKVLVVCSHLEEFGLREVRLESSAPIFDGYKTRSSQLKKLSLSQTRLLTTDFHENFLASITDTSHPCRSHLRELIVASVFGDDPHGIGDILNDKFIQLLDTCPQLHRLHIISAPYFMRELRSSEWRFQKRDGENLGICKKPLSLENKLAFLSCLKFGSTRHDSLASDVVALILHFAATPVVRQCAIHCDTRDYESEESDGSDEENWAEGWDEETGIF